MGELPAGTVTFLFTDVEGSTRLLHEHGERYAELLSEHRRLLRQAFRRHGGVEVDTQGDAFFYAFARASDALTAAEEGRRALAPTPVRVRMGVHTGEPQLTEEGYVGLDVHKAARIAAAGHGGQVLVSEGTARLAGAEGLVDLGPHRLKDLSAPERLFQFGEDEFPPPRTLYRTNLPVPATPFLGREREVAQVAALLRREDVRLVTLTGPGGTGKTRLGLQAAAAAAGEYPDGVWWVPLAPVRDPALVVGTAARTLGATDDVAEAIGDRRLLVLLDNFEHVLDAAAELGELTSRCPHVDLMVTSRVALRLAGEWDYAVDPLREREAVELFRERARAARRDFEADGRIAELCARLDHLPLAVELAAARVRVMGTGELLERLERRLPVLAGGTRDAPARQRTLRATIEWSYDLLGGDERRLLPRLAVFVGGFTLTAAEAVCGADVAEVEALAEHSLVRRWQDGRLGMLETIREFAGELLDTSGERDAIARRHAEYFLRVAESANLALDALGKGPQRHELVLPDQHNCRAAIDWATEADPELGLRLAVALENVWVMQDPTEGARRFQALLERAGDDADVSLRARAWRDYGGSADMAGDVETAEQAYLRSGALFREAGDERGVAEANFRLGVIAEHRHDPETARRRYEESLEVFRSLGDAIGVIQALGNLGGLAFDAGDRESGRRLGEESLAMARDAGWVWWEVGTLGWLAEAAFEDGRTEEGERRTREALAAAYGIGDRRGIVIALARLARAAAECGDEQRARTLWAAIEAEEAKAPISRWALVRDRYATSIPQGPRSLRALSLDEAVEYALAES